MTEVVDLLTIERGPAASDDSCRAPKPRCRLWLRACSVLDAR